jgi:hypothetical protein
MHGFRYSVLRDPPVHVLELPQSGDDLLSQFFLPCLEAMVLALLLVLSDSLCHQGPHLGIMKECSAIYSLCWLLLISSEKNASYLFNDLVM